MICPPSENPAVLIGQRGAENLSHTQLLALVLSGSKKFSPRDIELGRHLVGLYTHPSRIDRASLGELCSAGGLDRHRAARLKAAFELGRRSIFPSGGRPRLTNSREAANYFLPRLGNADVEKFSCALLDSRNRLIKDVVVATGTVNACFIHPREVFRAAITESACAVILAHNHPSGELNPSEEDLTLTRRIMEAGGVVGIRVLDHIIVGQGGYFSFLDAGHLSKGTPS
jgi:DNA repair protein RadC